MMMHHHQMMMHHHHLLLSLSHLVMEMVVLSLSHLVMEMVVLSLSLLVMEMVVLSLSHLVMEMVVLLLQLTTEILSKYRPPCCLLSHTCAKKKNSKAYLYGTVCPLRCMLHVFFLIFWFSPMHELNTFSWRLHSNFDGKVS